MLIGTVASTAMGSFVLAIDADRVAVTWPEAPRVGERVAVEGSLRARDGTLVEAASVTVIRSHML